MGMITATRRGARSGLRRGFTLVEILAVLVILGVASAMIIPQIGSRDDLKTASMARVVMADLLYAQNRAVSLQQVHYVRFDTVGGRYEVLESMSPETLITHPVNKTAFTVLLAPDRNGGTRMYTERACGASRSEPMSFTPPLTRSTGWEEG